MTKYLQLTKLIEAEQIQNLSNYLKKDCPSPSVLNDAVIFLLKIYNKENSNFYEILHLLLICGADVNLHIIYSEKNTIKKEDKVSLLMFGIIHNDIKLINLILNFHPNLEQTDSLGRSAIIYVVIYDNYDSPDILNLLIKNNANVNFSLNIQMSQNDIEYHSVLTLSCFKDLVQIVKSLLINNVDTNFRTKPNGDTCLHLAVKYGSPELVGLLLSYNKINPEITNNNGKRAIELIKEDKNEKRMKNIFINYYKNINFNNIRINNQNQQQDQGGNYSGNILPNNENMEYYSRMINNNGNNDKSQNNQLKQLQQLGQFQMNINNGEKKNLPNDRFSYPPQGIMGMMNNPMKGNNLYSLNPNQNIAQDNNAMKDMTNGKNLDNRDDINNNEEMFNEQIKKDSSNYPDKIYNQAQSKMINNKNINQNIDHMNSYQINLLKNNLFNKFNIKSKMDYGIEIPVEFIKNTETSSNQGLGKFMKQNNIPIINLDLTNNKLLDLEYKIIELKEKIKEKNKSVINLEKELSINDEKIKKNTKALKGKEEEFQYFSLLNNQHKEEIIKLNNIKNELIGQIPPDQISLKSNKNISYSQYKKLKFEPPVVDELYIFKTLQKDLTDYEKYIDYLIYKKKPKIESLLNKIILIIKEIDPGYELKVYGSYAYGLGLPWSNLNLILVNKRENSNNKTEETVKEDNLADVETTVGEKSAMSEAQSDNLSHTNPVSNSNNYNEINNNNNNDDIERTDLLVKLIYYFRNINWIIKPKFDQIENFISFTTNEEYGKIEVNISIENKNHNGLKVVELIKSYIKEYSVLKPLYYALRTLLKQAFLHLASTGGLCSYGLILMLVSFIQSQRDNNKTDNEYIIGKTFYEFLLHYGIKFDFNKYVILTYKINETNISSYEKEVYNISQNAKEFMIVDPLNKNNNVAKSTFQFMNIKMALLIAFMVTKEDCDCGCHYGKAFYENSFTSIEHSYLKRIFNSVKRFSETEK